MSVPGLAACFLAGAAIFAVFRLWARDWEWLLWAVCAPVCAVAAVTDFAAGDIGLGVFSAACAVSAAWSFWSGWRRRRKRRRGARSLGAKSRALIAGLVSRMRQSGQPRRVLRPVPEGAR